MRTFLRRLSTNQRLAALALLLGVVAVAARPTRAGRATIDSRELAALMARGVDRVQPRALAGWIIQGRADYLLIDLRDAAAFAAGVRIPSAQNIPVSALPDAVLPPDEPILLVADDEARAAQAWFLLTVQGREGVAIVRGGLRGWEDDVLYPNVDGVSAAERAGLEAVSTHFGGAPRTAAAGGAVLTPQSLARAAAPPPQPPAAGAKKAAPAKKREGC
jgi:rhodanese-related sulfurtransferase